MIFVINNLKYDTDKMELIAICAVAIILIKMGYGGETWQYWVILVLMTVYGGAFACEKDKEELE